MYYLKGLKNKENQKLIQELCFSNLSIYLDEEKNILDRLLFRVRLPLPYSKDMFI